MMSHHINPYHYGPGVLGAAPAVTLVDPLWLNTPAPYGPLFMQIDGALTSLSLHHELVNVILLRLLAIGGVLLMALGIASLARSYGRDPSYVLTLAILNPVTLLHLVGGAHNDALMLGLLVAGIAAGPPRETGRRHRPVCPGRRRQGPRRPRHPLHRMGVDGRRGPSPSRVRPLLTAG